MKITHVEPESIATDLGIQPGDVLLEINGRKVLDQIDFRFHEGGETVLLKVARGKEVVVYDIEKDEDERIGMGFEDMKILSCGNDCIFCFVDQNPVGLRKQLYFRDGDYRLSFMYGNYTTMTNAGPAILERIVTQRLSPQYISVHVTDYEVRKLLMGLKKDDYILDKIKYLHDHEIDMHTQIVLCPGINDGAVLEKTVGDLYQFRNRIISLAIVPVGLTDHRFGLFNLRKVDGEYAGRLLDTAGEWQSRFRKEVGRAFVYPSDEFYIVAGREIPPAKEYDDFPQIENGVGMVRTFLREFKQQTRSLPRSIPSRRVLTLVTAELPAGIIEREVVSRLRDIGNVDINLVVAPNMLYGGSVTVAGLLSGKCIYSALRDKHCGDLVLLPPEVLNPDGVFLDNSTIPQLEQQLGVPVMMFDGRWADVIQRLRRARRTPPKELLRNDHQTYQSS